MKCDLHVHTHRSYDSTSAPEDIVGEALKKGIDCLAITDHHCVKAVKEVAECSEGKSILIIPGIEVKSKQGDILGLNVKDAIPPGLSVIETIEKIRKQGGMVIIPHPFSRFTPFRGRLDDFIDEIDGIEVLNASIFKSENQRALDFAKKKSLCFTAGSDAHFPNFIGGAYLEIPGENLSLPEVLQSIRNKKGNPKGRETNLLEKLIDHSKRNIAKLTSL